MRKLCFLVGLLLCSAGAYAQMSQEGAMPVYATFYLQLKLYTNVPAADVNVLLVDDKATIAVKGLTDKNGKVQLWLPVEKTYFLELNGERQPQPIKVSQSKRIITYPYTWKPTGIKNSPVKDNPAIAEADVSEIIIRFADKAGKAYGNVPMKLTLLSSGQTYNAVSAANGEAKLKLTTGGMYKLSVETVDSFKYFNVPSGGTMKLTVTYVPTVVQENTVRDTIWQQFTRQEPTTQRAFVHVLVKDYSDNPLPNEKVAFVDKDNPKLVYAAMTNKQGVAVALLPKKKKYLLSLKYEPNIDLLTYKDGPELHGSQIELNYHGSSNIEAYFAQVQRDQEGFRQDFLTGKVKPAAVPQDNSLIQKKPYGFLVNFQEGGNISTPALANGKMLVSDGYYSHNFFALDAKTGQGAWAMEFAEAGPSPAAIADGVVLVSTESCTLYAVDVNTGRLLWSKWLSNYVYSSPTVANGKVYVTYPNQLTSNKSTDKFVLGCFDLHTGQIVWQKWVDDEALASVVAAGDKVYMTSRKGTLYAFNAKNGADKKQVEGKIVTPPTIAKDLVYVGQVDKEGKIKYIAVYKADDLAAVQSLRRIATDFEELVRGAQELMVYNDCRTASYHGKNYNLMGTTLYCTDALSGNQLWMATISDAAGNGAATSSIPIFVGGKLVIADNAGDVRIIDPNTGKLLKTFSTHEKGIGQLSVDKGWVYGGSLEGRIIAVDTKDPSLTGWGMWNKDGAHNPVIE